jgi:hypothetical protein
VHIIKSFVQSLGFFKQVSALLVMADNLKMHKFAAVKNDLLKNYFFNSLYIKFKSGLFQSHQIKFEIRKITLN